HAGERPRALPRRARARARRPRRAGGARHRERLGAPRARPGRDLARGGVPRPGRGGGRGSVTKILLVCRRELAAMCGGPLAWVLAALALYLGMLAATAVGPALLYALHPFAVAPVLAGYAGLVLLGVAFVACGAAASTVSENQVVSAMLAYGVLVFAWFATWNEAAIGARIAPALLQLSLFDHFYGFAQGVIDSRDVVYLLAFAALFLFLAHRSLGARAWRGL